jgi:branched-chain amino acid transport system permease protein
MGPRARQLRARLNASSGRLAKRTGLDRLAAEWRRIPPRYRGWAPFLIVVSLAIAYPFYVTGLPTNIPLILTLPTVHDSVTIIVFVVMAVGLNVVVGYAGLLDLGYVAFYAIGAYTAG